MVSKKLQTIMWSVLMGVLIGTSAVPPASAQMTAATAAGRVLDDQGAPVDGAQVEMVHVPSGTVSRSATDAAGRFNLRGLRVGGPYRVTAVRDGFRIGVVENQFLQLDDTGGIDVVLERTGVVEEVVVAGSPVRGVFDPARMGTGTVVDRVQIEGLPSLSRNIQDYVRTDPRISQVDKSRGEISAGGQNTRFNNIRIDGVSTNDAFGLEANNLPTNRQPISMDSIESINIALANYDVARSGYTGASVDAVTRSGTNEFDSSAYYIFRDNDWTGKRDGTRFTGFNDESTFGFTLGGPIVEDRLFFFAAYDQFGRSAAAPTFGPVGSGAGQIVAGITGEDLQEVQQIAQDVWGFDAGSFEPPSSLDTDIEDILLKLDWNINENHRASFRYNKTEQEDPYLRNIGARELSLSSFWHTNTKDYKSYVAQLYSDWSDSFFTEMSLSYAEQGSTWDIGEPLPSIRICLNSETCSGADSIWLGSERFRHVNVLETETLNFFAAGTYYLGEHELKFGVEYESRDIFNLFGRDQYGHYEFYGIEAFREGTPGAYNLFYPTEGDVTTRAAAWTLDNWAVFLQDSWDIDPRLSITAGLRLDIPKVRDEPPFNQAASAFFGLRNDSTIDGNQLLQPRVGFNFRPELARETQIRGGVGLFQGIAANVWLSNPFTNNNVIQGAIFDNDPAASGITFNPDPHDQPGDRPPPGLGGNVDFIDPNLRLPAVWKSSLAIDHELPWLGLIASAEVVFTDVKEGIRYEKPNLGAPTGTAPDGRPIYWSVTDPDAFTGAASQATANFNPDFGVDSTIARPSSKGGGHQFTVSLQGPPDPNWFWNVGYTYTSAEEVNSLTSSQAASNWNNTIRTDRNADVAERSVYEIRDRFTAALTYRRPFFADLMTSFGMFYEGRSGRPYTYTFINDANGDRRSGVDPFYIPSGPGDVIFTGGAEMEAAFFDYVERTGGLREQRGSIAGINAQRSPWVHQIDLRISQEVPGMWGGKGEIWLDILNFTNLLNSDWGRIEEVGFPYGLGVARFEGVDPDSGRYVYSFDESEIRDMTLRDTIGESRWALQVGARYRF